LAYADDIGAVGESIVRVKENFIKIEEEAQRIGLRVNEGKTKYMPVHAMQNVTMGVYTFQHVQTFKYLGAVITADNHMQEDIKQRITQANTFAVQTLLKSKFITRKAKTGIYQTMIRPVATCASETCSRHRAPKKV